MSLYCPDGSPGAFSPPCPPPPKPERGAPWRPPDISRDTCGRCGRLAWQHWTVRPEAWA